MKTIISGWIWVSAIAASVILCGIPANAAQTQVELTGTPVTSFYNDFESYETRVTYGTPNRYRYTSRVISASGAAGIVYTGNATENIPVFNNKTINDRIQLPLGGGTSIYPLVVYNPALTSLQYEALSDIVYKAEGPDGNVVYGGLPGYYGWWGAKMFQNYPDINASSFRVNPEPQASNRSTEKRIAVMNEIDDNYDSNKFLMMDTRYTADAVVTSVGGSQVAVFGKHNLDLAGKSVFRFRLYPYATAASTPGFTVNLTCGEYNLSFDPTFTYHTADTTDPKRSYESQVIGNYSGTYFSESNGTKYELLRLTQNDFDAVAGTKRFMVDGKNVTAAGYKLISEPAPLTNPDDAKNSASPGADVYYDVSVVIDRNGEENTFLLIMRDNTGNMVYTNAVNGEAQVLSDNNGFFSGAAANDRFGIVFEAYTSKSSSNYRTKVALDNLSFSKTAPQMRLTDEAEDTVERLESEKQDYNSDMKIELDYTDFIMPENNQQLGTVTSNGGVINGASVTAKGGKLIIEIPSSLLTASATYEVHINVVNSDVGARSEAMDFSFKTKDAYSINSVSLQNVDGIGKVNFNISNYTDSSKPIIVMAAVYNKQTNTVGTVYYKPLVFAAEADITDNIGNIRLPGDYNSGSYEVRFFILNNSVPFSPLILSAPAL